MSTANSAAAAGYRGSPLGGAGSASAMSDSTDTRKRQSKKDEVSGGVVADGRGTCAAHDDRLPPHRAWR
jgi:hypothetical protein